MDSSAMESSAMESVFPRKRSRLPELIGSVVVAVPADSTRYR